MAKGGNNYAFEDAFGNAIFLGLGIVVLMVLAMTVSAAALLGIPAYVGYRLYKESPRRAERLARDDTMTLYRYARAGSATLSEDQIDAELAAELPPGTPPVLTEQLLDVGRRLFEAESLTTEVPPPPALCNTIEGARYRDMLARAGQAGMDRNMALSALRVIAEVLAVVAREVPREGGDLMVPVSHFLTRPNDAVSDVIAPFFAENDYAHFKTLRRRLDANFAATHRTNPVLPRDHRGDDVVETYLAGTPLADLFTLKAPFSIPDERRFEHTHLIGGSGHGKTQTMQFHIARDLEDVGRGEKSVVVIDSQGDLINTILRARTVDPDRVVLIDAEDIDYPVCLNLFSVGQERLAGYDALERERLTNSIIELYDFVLGSLLAAGMTQKQSVLFRYVTRLMFHIPDATIHTFRELMEKGCVETYRPYVERLEGTAKRFFETEFDGKEFEQTKQQVLRRLYGILENRTFERMFSHPRSKLDLFTEMNAGKLILINTSKSLLKENGTEIFGRFFIALIAQAAQERATLPEWERMPTLVYIDEAQDYFDRNVGIILAQARKYNVGMMLAHQYLGQLDGKLQEAFEANTSIKMAGGVSSRDARALSGQFNCDADLILRQPKGSFATFVRGLTPRAIPIDFPFFVLEKGPQATREEIEAIRNRSRARYAEPLRPVDTDLDPNDGRERPGGEDAPSSTSQNREEGADGDHGGSSEITNDDRPPDPDDDDPTKPSDRW